MVKTRVLIVHAGDLTYASTFGGSISRLLIVKIDPKDVVSIPLDCNGKKLRTCKYTVVAEYTGPLPDTLYGRVESGEIDNDFDDDFDSESEECEECGIELTEFDEYTVCDECISNAVSSLEASYTSR